MKYKTKRRETMRYLKRLSWYISILILIVVIAGCGKGNETKEAREQSKRALKLFRCIQSKISRIYTTKKDIEINKKSDKGTWTIYTDFAKSNKPGELDDEGMVLNLIGILEPLKAIILLLHLPEW